MQTQELAEALTHLSRANTLITSCFSSFSSELEALKKQVEGLSRGGIVTSEELSKTCEKAAPKVPEPEADSDADSDAEAEALRADALKALTKVAEISADSAKDILNGFGAKTFKKLSPKHYSDVISVCAQCLAASEPAVEHIPF